MLKIECECGKRLSFDLSLAGKSGRCPRCKSSIRIPEPGPEPPAPLQPAGSLGLLALVAGVALAGGGALVAWKLRGRAPEPPPPARQAAAEPAPVAAPERGRSLRYAAPRRSKPAPERLADPEKAPAPPRPEPVRKPAPEPAPKQVSRPEPKPVPSPTPKPEPKPPALPREIVFSPAEAARAAGTKLALQLTDGTTLRGEVAALETDRLLLRQAAVQVGVPWSRISFETRFSLKWQVTSPTSATGFLELAQVALAHERPLLARRALARAQRIDPAVARRFDPHRARLVHLLREASGPLLRQGMQYLKQKNLLHALGKFNEARALHDGPEASNGIGEAYYHQRRTEEALSHFDRALELQPRYLPALLNRGYVHFFDQRYQAARRDFLAALQVAPANPLARSQAAIVQKVLDGPGWAKGFDVKTEHYFLSTDHSPEYGRRMAAELEGIYRSYDRQFRVAKRKNTRLRFRVIMFKERTLYMRYTQGVTGSHFAATRSAGFYSPLLKQLVLWDNRTVVGTLYHEGFHQFLDYFLENPPRWFNEGLAEVFETARKKADGSYEFFLVNRKDLPRVQAAMRRGQAYPCEKLIGLPADQFYKNANLTYPLSWSLCYFLIHGDAGAYRPLITRYFQSLLEGQSPEQAYAKAFGRVDLPRLNQRWKAYILGLK